jgi:hypothetical protein
MEHNNFKVQFMYLLSPSCTTGLHCQRQIGSPTMNPNHIHSLTVRPYATIIDVTIQRLIAYSISHQMYLCWRIQYSKANVSQITVTVTVMYFRSYSDGPKQNSKAVSGSQCRKVCEPLQQAHRFIHCHTSLSLFLHSLSLSGRCQTSVCDTPCIVLEEERNQLSNHLLSTVPGSASPSHPNTVALGHGQGCSSFSLPLGNKKKRNTNDL